MVTLFYFIVFALALVMTGSFLYIKVFSDKLKSYSDKLHIDEAFLQQIVKVAPMHDLGKIAKNIVHFHHEKWNGQGYPLGLSKTEIPIEARIMALADVFDALVSKRCYKEAFSYDEAFYNNYI